MGKDCGGLLVSGIMVLVNLSLLPTRGVSEEFRKYSKKRDKSSPFYVKGCFRESGEHHILSELKGLYWCEVIVLVQVIVFLIYGIGSVVVGRFILFEILSVPLSLFFPLLHSAIVGYYEDLLKTSIKRKPKDKEWIPFEIDQFNVRKAEQLSMEYKNFQEILKNLSLALQRNGYVLWENDLIKKDVSIRLYYKKEKGILHIYEIFRNDAADDDLNKKGNSIFKRFLKEYKSAGQKYTFIYLTSIVCTDAMTGALWRMVNNPVSSNRAGYWLSCVVSFDHKEIYISRQGKTYKKALHQKLRTELLERIQY